MKNIKVNVLDKLGKQCGEITLNSEVFGADRNEILIHEVAVALQNNQRQGTKSALTMAEVRGHHKKPYAQKHTGNARHGTTKGPQFKGGGVVFAPKPRDFSTKINQKKKYGAFISAISAKLADKELIVIKDLELKEYKTKNVAAIIEKLKVTGKKVMFVNAYKPEFVRSAANIPTAKVTTAEQLSVLDIVNNRYIVISEEAVRTVEKQYSQEEIKEVGVKTVTEVKKTGNKTASQKATVTQNTAVKAAAEKSVKKAAAVKAVKKEGK
jgi:large subunit ribosomal protein L4